MTIIEQIKAEIERLKTVQLKRIQEGDLVDAEPYDKNEAYNELLDFLTTLESEKPMNLEEEINRYLREECSDDDEPSVSDLARHFAKWGAEHAMEQMMKEAVEGKIIFLLNGDVAINIGDIDEYKLGDKVRIIIKEKENEQSD